MKLVKIGLASLLFCTCASAETLEPHNEPEKAFLAYVDATRTKNLAMLDRLIADDYMTLNGNNRVADKQSELEETKENPRFNTMQVDEIHSRIVKGTAVISAIITAAYTSSAGKPVQARVRVLATLLKRHGQWQIIADESAPAHSS